jgi:hypothetical protein
MYRVSFSPKPKQTPALFLLVSSCWVAPGCDNSVQSAAPGSALLSSASTGASNAAASSLAASVVSAAAQPPGRAGSAAPRRVKDRAELVLGTKQRLALETSFPEAKGFLDGLDVEERLYAKGLKHDAVKAASAALDSVARDKWVLFVGNIIAPSPSGFDLAVRYVPREPQDLMGFTSAWLNVHFEQIQGYDSTAYKAGDLIAVLARYGGKQRTVGGYDVVALGKWAFPD